jgi:hypothetical protein
MHANIKFKYVIIIIIYNLTMYIYGHVHVHTCTHDRARCINIINIDIKSNMIHVDIGAITIITSS